MADTEVITEKLGFDDAGKDTIAAPDKMKAVNGLSVDDSKCKSGDNMKCSEKTIENGKDINCKSPQVNGDINDCSKSPSDVDCESKDISSDSAKTDILPSAKSEKNGDICLGVVSDNSSGIKINNSIECKESDTPRPIITNSLSAEDSKLSVAKSEDNEVKPIKSSEKTSELGADGDELDIKEENIEIDPCIKVGNNENDRSSAVEKSETSKPKSESSNDSSVNSDKVNSDNGELKSDIPVSSELVSDCDMDKDKCDTIKGEDEISVLDKDKSDKSPDKSPSKRAKKNDSKADLPKRITRSSSGISKAVKYTDGTEVSIDDDDEIKITKEVKKKGEEVKKKDEESDIEMIEECDPLAISDADVIKAKESVVKEPKKDSGVIIIDTNTLLKQQGSITATAHTTSKTVKAQSVSASAQTTSAGAAPLNPATQIQNAIQAITGGNPAIQGLQSAYLSAIQQVLIAQGGGQVSNPHYLAQLQQYYNTLGALQDDAYVIEAPSFIVPYVMEGKPIESIKEFLEKINKEHSESEKKLSEEKSLKKTEHNKDEPEKVAVVEIPSNENKVEEESKSSEVEKLNLVSLDKDTLKDDMEISTNEEDKVDTSKKSDCTVTPEKDTSENEKKDESSNSVEKEVTSEEKVDAKEDDCSSTKNNKKSEGQDEEHHSSNKDLSEKEKCLGNEEKVDLEDGKVIKENKNGLEAMEVDEEEKTVKESSKTDDEKSEKEVKTSDNTKDDDNKENTNNLELKVNKKDEEVIDLDKDDVPAVKKEDFKHLGRWEGYYKSALGKFFLDLGLNHAQEFIQSDLLKMQKRKLEKMKTNPSKQDILGVKILEGQLGSTKRKNEHLHIPLKTCKFCSYKTESQLVMERHLESPHMVNYTYKCNFCEFETRGPQVILFHTEAEHNVRGRLERAPAFFQCPICPYEDNNKSKMTRHSFSCIKKFKPDKNLDLSDWEPPAKIPKIQRGRPNSFNKTFESLKMPNILPKNLSGLGLNIQSALSSGLISSGSPSHVNSMVGRGRGRPVGSYKTISQTLGGRTSNAAMMYQNRAAAGLLQQIPGVTSAQQLSIANQVLQSVAQGANRVPRILPASSNSSIIPGLAASSSITIQSVQNKTGSSKSPQQPSISITPLPRGGTQPTTTKSNSTNSARPAFVICEICDGYIKDLEQLRNHMNLIHKVKIHPKMIYNRPPLNCQKCQHRFFTDQGLERHLLGTHGLVTSSMQEAANKGKDAGRCPICGKVFQWKLLNHVSRDHKMTLKPAHLSYKCTVCTATFNMYRLFENHVYSAHSVVNKNKNNETTINSNSSTVKKPADVPLKINDEITIIPQPASKNPKGDGKASPKKSDSPTVSKEITITKVGSRSRRRSGGGVEVISLDDSPQKRQLEENPKKKARETSTAKRARTTT